MLQSRAGGAIKLNSRFFKHGQGADQIQFRQRKVTLSGKSLIARSRSQVLLFLRDLERPLGKVPCLAGGLHPRGSLLQGVLRVANLDADLLLELLHPQFSLPILEFRAVLIGLGHTIPEWDVQVQTDVVVGGGVVEGVLQRSREIPRHGRGAIDTCRIQRAG